MNNLNLNIHITKKGKRFLICLAVTIGLLIGFVKSFPVIKTLTSDVVDTRESDRHTYYKLKANTYKLEDEEEGLIEVTYRSVLFTDEYVWVNINKDSIEQVKKHKIDLTGRIVPMSEVRKGQDFTYDNSPCLIISGVNRLPSIIWGVGFGISCILTIYSCILLFKQEETDEEYLELNEAEANGMVADLDIDNEEVVVDKVEKKGVENKVEVNDQKERDKNEDTEEIRIIKEDSSNSNGLDLSGHDFD